MPKEVIRSDSGDISVRVGWTKDQYVQVASVKDEAFSVHWTAVPPHSIVTPTDVCDGMYATLDRDGLNQLIRVLRRARDQVYGKDQ